jgi:hypothetical protein
LNRFDRGLGTNMRKAAHPSDGMGSSNPHRWRGEQLNTMVMLFVMLFVLFVWFLTRDSSVVLIVRTF